MLLHKPQVYRHLLFNRITEQDGVEVSAKKTSLRIKNRRSVFFYLKNSLMYFDLLYY